MKINGKTFKGAFEKAVVFPRGDDRIVFKVQAVLSYDDFDKLCPRPEAPIITRPGKSNMVDVDDKAYVESVNIWAVQRTNYLVLTSLKATEGLEWDEVKLGDPETWDKYQDELSSAGLTDTELGVLVNAVMEVNGMDEDKIKQATEDFLSEVVGA